MSVAHGSDALGIIITKKHPIFCGLNSGKWMREKSGNTQKSILGKNNSP